MAYLESHGCGLAIRARARGVHEAVLGFVCRPPLVLDSYVLGVDNTMIEVFRITGLGFDPSNGDDIKTAVVALVGKGECKIFQVEQAMLHGCFQVVVWF